jgi:hypothetical protein
MPTLVLSFGQSDLRSNPKGQAQVRSLVDFDIRQAQRGVRSQSPTESQLAAAAELRERVAGLEIKFNPVTGAPRHLFSLSERLTPPSSDPPGMIALRFLKTNRALFRLSDRQIDGLSVVKNYRTQHNGVTHLVFQQFFGDLPVFQGEIKVNIDREGQILSINGNHYPGVAPSLAPALSAAEAVDRAVQTLFSDLSVTLTETSASTGANRATVFDRGPFTEDVTAKLVIFPAHDRARLAWNVRLHLMERFAWYDALVDAETGEMLFVHNLYQSNEPRGLVFPIHPDRGPQVLQSFVGNPLASPNTWVSPLPNISTQGNNALALPFARNVQQHFEFRSDNTYNRTGGNRFDLDTRTVRLTPNAVGGYDAQLVPLSFDAMLGTNVTSRLSFFGLLPDPDDGFFTFSLGFSFPFFGTNYTSVSINANGFVTFGGEDFDFSESWADLMLDRPRIAPFWHDLNAGGATGGGGVFAKTAPDRVTITWNRVPRFGMSDSNTVQLTLFMNGQIEISFNGIASPEALIGITRGGGEFDLSAVDFSANVPITGRREGLAEKFPSVELDAAVTNLFYHVNFMHDYLYNLGFNEAAGNFQINNFSRGGMGNDPVRAFAQDGFNGAGFGTPEDGQPAFAAFGLFIAPPFRNADAAFDADVIYHEYVHGLTNRLVGGPFNVAALRGVQSDAMGEGWSDAYSISITDDPITGEYSTGNRERGIRRVNFAQSPLVYGDFGNRFGPVSSFFTGNPGGIALDRTFIPEDHDDGEIWASALWDLRTMLGRTAFERLITDALKFTPANPSMLDARDAILIADVASNNGANANTIWRVFSARGMGFSAKTDHGDDPIIFQAFDQPSSPLPARREVVFFDNMSMGVNGWTTSSSALWHQSDLRVSRAWYYGRESAGNYDTGARNFGTLTSPTITLPTIPAGSALVLEFDHFMAAEPTSTLFDNGYVRIVDAATGQVTQVACVFNDTVGGRGGTGFEREMINISQFAGRSVRLQFYFDTLDRFVNTGEGWYIDNVQVGRLVR